MIEAREVREHAAEPLPVGAVLGRTFSIWARNVVPFSVLSAVAFAPLILYTFRVDGPPNPERTGSLSGPNDWWPLSVILGGPVLGLVASGFVSYGVVQGLRGEPAPLVRCLVAGLRRLPAIGWVVALFVGWLVVCMLPGFLVTGCVITLTARGGEAHHDSAPYMVVLAAAVGIPVLTCLVRLCVLVPVATVERGGGLRAFARSRSLTSGSRWRVLAVFMPLFLLHWGGIKVIGEILGALEPGANGWMLFIWGTLAFSVVVSNCLMAVASAVVYYDRRVAKEGVTVEDIAKVFD